MDGTGCGVQKGGIGVGPVLVSVADKKVIKAVWMPQLQMIALALTQNILRDDDVLQKAARAVPGNGSMRGRAEIIL